MFKTRKRLKAYQRLVEDIEKIVNGPGDYVTMERKIREYLQVFRLCEILHLNKKVEEKNYIK